MGLLRRRPAAQKLRDGLQPRVALRLASPSGSRVRGFHSRHFHTVCQHALAQRLQVIDDHCVDRIFLRRVGGGYIFVHRLLMEHFADMYAADEK